MISGMRRKNVSRETVATCMIMILAAVLRLYNIHVLPNGLQQDETFSLWNAWALLKEGTDSTGKAWPVYLATWGDGQSALYSWLTIPFLFFSGGEPSYLVARLPQALVGIATVFFAMQCCRRLWGTEMGLWTGFLLAICPWHVMMSRWGLDANIAPGMLTIAFYFFVCGLENEKYFPIAAVFYGLSLYGYAVVWMAVPVMLLLQLIYGSKKGKIRFSRYTVGSVLILLLFALPLLLFVLINAGLIDEIIMPFMTIPKMPGYRGGEIALSMKQIRENLYSIYYLLRYQNQGTAYDILQPYGLFYSVGSIFIIIGLLCLLVRVGCGIWKRRLESECLLVIQLIGGGIVCLFVYTRVHQTNILYIPLVVCQAYGIKTLFEGIKRILGKGRILYGLSYMLIAIYFVNLMAFQKDYYTDFRKTLNAYYAEGVQEAIEYVAYANAKGESVYIDRGAQWPRMLLFTKTLPSEFLEEVVYKENGVEPYSFVSKEVTYYNGIDLEHINKAAYYILYYNIKPELFTA